MNPNPKEKLKKARPNWLDLPREVMLHILLKLGTIDLICNVQPVCSSWRELVQDPILYTHIDLHGPLKHHVNPSSSKARFLSIIIMAERFVDRSCGQLVDFSIIHYGNDEILWRIAKTSCRLKRLRLDNCPLLSDNGLVEFVKGMPSLEELELSLCSFTAETIEAVGRCCPKLKSFRLNHRSYGEDGKTRNDEALAIAGNMPGLRSLQLFGNLMHNEGLEAILDNCPYLEYLDIRECHGVHTFGLKKCYKSRISRDKYDPTEDCEFDHEITHLYI